MTKDRVIVKFNGGLGNQMFQWAYARSLTQKFDMQMFFDMSFFKKKYARPFELGIFGIKPQEVSEPFDKFKINTIWKLRKFLHKKSLFNMNFYAEPHFEFDKELLVLLPETFVEGFFQSEKYFNQISNLLLRDFEFKNDLDETNKLLAEKIQSTNSISLHIRRGDYVQKKRYQNVYATCSIDYYKKAVEMIACNSSETMVFIFSDDKEWVKENLKIPYECVYVDNNFGENSYKDMQLMSLCKHNVIANSSFSWWSAWLNKNPQKIVIAPKKWFNDSNINQKDVIPENWLRIDN